MPHWEFMREHAVGVPTLAPWIAEEVTTSTVSAGAQPLLLEGRHGGNQLPYVDRVVAENTPELQTMILKAAAGEYDVLTQLAQLKDMPLYAENAAASNVCTVLHRLDQQPAPAVPQPRLRL